MRMSKFIGLIYFSNLESFIMKIKLLIVASLATFALTACQHQTDTAKQQNPVQQPDTCNAASFQYLIGKPASTLDGMRFAKPMRLITPGMGVTMDFNPERLNIMADEKGVITSMHCS
ncbi:Peptidase inhibitor I78 family [Ewingella americana]|uniref:Peptidase inhibitor I78 family protein n=3 Tax=Ewingella americana TaxID=41202 RepID=A0A085G0R8_EWIA3|nr:hypothetical protein GEAM_4439 [Ewingella americana ATCC 33852]STS10572.1 Peptidase inhibitor I78 family [Ewingella americana]